MPKEKDDLGLDLKVEWGINKKAMGTRQLHDMS